MTDNNKNFKVKNGLDVGPISVNQNGEITTNGPNSIDLYTNNFEADGVEVWLRHDNGVEIYTANGAYGWAFKKDGTVGLPTLTTDHAGTGQTLRFADPTQQVVITNSTATEAYPNSTRIVVQGSEGYADSGEGGDIYLWAGNSGAGGGSGGDIKIDAGIGYNNSVGGTIKLRAGDSSGDGSGTGGFLDLYGGTGANGGGPVRVYSGNNSQQINVDDTGVKVFNTLTLGGDNNTISVTAYNTLGVNQNWSVRNVLSVGNGSGYGYITSVGNQDLVIQTSDNDGPGPRIQLQDGADVGSITFYQGHWSTGYQTVAVFNTTTNTINCGLTINSADSSKALTVSNNGVALPVLAADFGLNGYKLKGGSYEGNTLALPTGFGPILQAAVEGSVLLKASTDNTQFSTLTFDSSAGVTLDDSTGTRFTVGGNSRTITAFPTNAWDEAITLHQGGSLLFALKTGGGANKTIGFSRGGGIFLNEGQNIVAVGGTDLVLNAVTGGATILNSGDFNSYVQADEGSGAKLGVYNPDLDALQEANLGFDGTFTLPGLLQLAVFTATGLTSVSGAVGQIAIVSNSASGGNPNGMMAFWDTTNGRWSYVHDNGAV